MYGLPRTDAKLKNITLIIDVPVHQRTSMPVNTHDLTTNTHSLTINTDHLTTQVPTYAHYGLT